MCTTTLHEPIIGKEYTINELVSQHNLEPVDIKLASAELKIMKYDTDKYLMRQTQEEKYVIERKFR